MVVFNDTWQELVDQMITKRDEMRGEIDRLREKLERVRQAIEALAHSRFCSGGWDGKECDCYVARLKAAFYGKEVEGG